ncbi:MAG: hypothetical protein ACK58T_26215, partial [Phycisphaerae bacterium]
MLRGLEVSGPRKAKAPVRRWRTAAPKPAAQAQHAQSPAAAERRPMRRTIRGGRPYFVVDPAIDKVLNMVVV